MKNWITQFIGVCAAVFFFSSCEKEEVQAVAQPGEAPTLQLSSNTATLNADNPSADALSFTWKPASYGYQAVQRYTLQFDKKGGNFASPKSIDVGNSTSYKVSSKELNSIFIGLGLPAGSASELDVRLVSSIDPAVKSLYSAVTSFSGTPYPSLVVYPLVYVPGGYSTPAWSHGSAATLAAFTSNKDVYEGYVYLKDADNFFKITKLPEWGADSNIFGDAAESGTSGNTTNPGHNFKVSGAGYYLLRMDFSAQKLTATKTTWSIIGDATADKTWTVDTPLNFDTDKKTWSVTVTLDPGKLKFRANGDWGLNYGDGYKDANGKEVAPDGLLDKNGNDIVISTGGVYVITMDLTNPGNFQYKITKQ